MIHAGSNATELTKNKLSALFAVTLLASQAGIEVSAQEYSGSGSRGGASLSRVNPRSPLSMIRKSGAQFSAYPSTEGATQIQTPQGLAQLEHSNQGSWAQAGIGNSIALTAKPAIYAAPVSSEATGQRTVSQKQTKFDRRYLKFPHARINQVQQYPASLPKSGTAAPSMDKFDDELCAFMKQWQIPGASVSIVKNGKLLYSRGYGFADFETKKPVKPDSLFRIGSVSKTLTSVAVLKLVEQRRLELSTPAIPLLNYKNSAISSRSYDPRIKQITIQNLLQGTAGWDRSHNGDPMFMPIAQQAAQKYSNSLRPTPEAIIRYQLDKPLDFEPGTKFSYSNLGYSILGEIISKTTSMKYADFVRQEILAPLGIYSLQPGRTRVFANNEVCYYGYPGENKGPSVFPNIQAPLPLEYGGDFYLEAMTADCGWIGTTADVAKFVSAVFGGTARHPLQAATVRQMIAKPQGTDSMDGTFFAMGWEIDPPSYTNKNLRIKKEGCLPGSTSLVLHRTDGMTCAIVFNSRPQLANVFQDETQKIVEKALNSCKTFD